MPTRSSGARGTCWPGDDGRWLHGRGRADDADHDVRAALAASSGGSRSVLPATSYLRSAFTDRILIAPCFLLPRADSLKLSAAERCGRLNDQRDRWALMHYSTSSAR